MSVVIVALPSEDEPVWKLSSEKKPHLTLLYMNDVPGNLENTLQFIQFAALRALTAFGMSVKKRGTLGEDDADVLFFEDSFGVKELREFRAHLLTNPDIAKVYQKADQFPGWIPHLTMGYPDAPGKKGEPHELSWINFDRIAVWVTDFEGPEFELDKRGMELAEDSAAWSADHGVHLMHYGRKGMKWGVRRASDKAQKRVGVGVGEIAPFSKTHAAEIAEAKLGIIDRLGIKLLDRDSLKAGNKEAKRQLDILNKAPLEKLDSDGLPTDGTLFRSKPQLEKLLDARKDVVKVKTLDDDILTIHEVKISNGPNDENRKVYSVNPEAMVTDYVEQSAPTSLDDVLEHYGRKGMKWGVRRDKPSGSRSRMAYDSATKTFNTKSVKAVNNNPKFKGKNLTKNKTLRDEYNVAVKNAFKSDMIKAARAARLTVAAGGALAFGFSTGFSGPAMVAIGSTALRTASAAFSTSTITRTDTLTPETISSPGHVITGNGSGRAAYSDSNGNSLLSDLTHSDVTDVSVGLVVFRFDDNGFVIDSAIVEVDQKTVAQADTSNLDDVLEHFGVKGMRWGVRRPVDANGLVKGTVKDAIKSSPDGGAKTLLTRSGGKRSDDQKRMEKNLKKNVEALSTAEIREMTSRIKAVKDFKAETAAQREAQRSGLSKLTSWALGVAREGAKSAAEKYAKEMIGDVFIDVLPKTKTQTAKNEKDAREKAKEKRAQEERDEKKAEKQKNDKTKSESKTSEPSEPKTTYVKSERVDNKPDSPEHQAALNELVYEITTLPRKED